MKEETLQIIVGLKDTVILKIEGTVFTRKRIFQVKEIFQMSITMLFPFVAFQDAMNNIVM